jgi:nitrate/TMAO reductase-like tetraheme cytochrome c subunit
MEGETVISVRRCLKCKTIKLENTDNFYKRAASGKHRTAGWNVYCKECWKEINGENKLRRKLLSVLEIVS